MICTHLLAGWGAGLAQLKLMQMTNIFPNLAQGHWKLFRHRNFIHNAHIRTDVRIIDHQK